MYVHTYLNVTKRRVQDYLPCYADWSGGYFCYSATGYEAHILRFECTVLYVCMNFFLSLSGDHFYVVDGFSTDSLCTPTNGLYVCTCMYVCMYVCMYGAQLFCFWNVCHVLSSDWSLFSCKQLVENDSSYESRQVSAFFKTYVCIYMYVILYYV